MHPGGIFISSVTGFQSDSCDDLYHPASATIPQPSLAPYTARSNISGMINCNRAISGDSFNTVDVGYGPDLATMVLNCNIVRADTVVHVDPSRPEASNTTVPQVRDHSRGSRVAALQFIHIATHQAPSLISGPLCEIGLRVRRHIGPALHLPTYVCKHSVAHHRCCGTKHHR
jgi:hypothetical protein